jgi:uncharacterized protein
MEIMHDKKEKKFYCCIDGLECLMNYSEESPNVLNFYHTYVPAKFRDRGIGEQIVTAAAKYALENGLTVIPGCSFAAYFFDKHKEYQNIIPEEYKKGGKSYQPPSCSTDDY